MEGITISKMPKRECHELRAKMCRHYSTTQKECQKRIQNSCFECIQKRIINEHQFCPFYQVRL